MRVSLPDFLLSRRQFVAGVGFLAGGVTAGLPLQEARPAQQAETVAISEEPNVRIWKPKPWVATSAPDACPTQIWSRTLQPGHEKASMSFTDVSDSDFNRKAGDPNA